MENGNEGRVEKLDLSLVKSREDEIILFYIWKSISKILMDGILNEKWKRGRDGKIGFKFSEKQEG